MQIKLLLPLFIATGLMADTFILNSSATNFESIEPLERDNKKEIVYDPNTNLMWQDDKTTKTTNDYWRGAKKHCETLKLAGFNDWRLPTITELKSIVDYSNYKLPIKYGFKNVTASYYITNSDAAFNDSYTWFVDFRDGGANPDPNISGLVRCVRDNKNL